MNRAPPPPLLRYKLPDRSRHYETYRKKFRSSHKTVVHTVPSMRCLRISFGKRYRFRIRTRRNSETRMTPRYGRRGCERREVTERRWPRTRTRMATAAAAGPPVTTSRQYRPNRNSRETRSWRRPELTATVDAYVLFTSSLPMESRRWVAVTVAAAMVVSAAVDGRAPQTTFPSARLLPWLPRNPFAPKPPPDNGNYDRRELPATVTDGRLPGGQSPASQQLPQYRPRHELQPDGRRPYVQPTAGGGATTDHQQRVAYVGHGNGDGNEDRGPRPKPAAHGRTSDATTTTVRPKLETTTRDRSIIMAPLKMCPEGQRMSPDRVCRPSFVDPEEEE